MGFLNKVKKSTSSITSKEDKVSKEAKEEAHHLKSDMKYLAKQMKTEESVVTKNDAFAILHSGPKNQKSFLTEFENITREGYVLNGPEPTSSRCTIRSLQRVAGSSSTCS